MVTSMCLEYHVSLFALFSGPTDAPGNLTVSKFNSNKVNINWIPVEAKSIKGEFKEYRVSYNLFFNSVIHELYLTSMSIIALELLETVFSVKESSECHSRVKKQIQLNYVIS